MQRDSEGLTGEKIMQDENFKRAALIMTEPEDVIEAWDTLMQVMRDGKNIEKIQAAKLILEYGKQKPVRKTDVTSGGDKITAGIFIEDSVNEDI